jgi:RND family efflux transporter MFP subunit
MRGLMLRWVVGTIACVAAGSVLAADLEIDSVVINLIAEAEVPAEEAGVLAEITVREGQRVKAGDLLARIDDRDAALDVAKARIILEQANDLAANDVKIRRAQQTLKLARLELMRSEEANKELDKVVSATQIEKLKIDVENALLEIEQAEKDLATARRGVEAAKNDLQIAERALQRRRVAAPIEGVVADVRRNPGEWLKPGETVIRIVRDDRLRAEGFVQVDALTSNLLGRAVTLHFKLPSGATASLPGEVTYVSPESNPINRQVRIWAEVDNRAGQLRAGTSAKMVIETVSAAESAKP